MRPWRSVFQVVCGQIVGWSSGVADKPWPCTHEFESLSVMLSLVIQQLFIKKFAYFRSTNPQRTFQFSLQGRYVLESIPVGQLPSTHCHSERFGKTAFVFEWTSRFFFRVGLNKGEFCTQVCVVRSTFGLATFLRTLLCTGSPRHCRLMPRVLQGYLAHKKPPPPRTLQ